jgi:hypothetical protein
MDVFRCTENLINFFTMAKIKELNPSTYTMLLQ